MTIPFAVNFFASGGLLFAFNQSTVEGKVIIALLMLGSLFSWSVMITKLAQVKQARRQTERFMAEFRSSRQPLSVFLRRLRFPGSPASAVYQSGCKELAYHLVGSEEVDDTMARRMADAEKLPASAMLAVRAALEREVGVQALLLEHRMIMLATAVSGAPFMGLLGTVWGVMDTFSGVALAGKASLAAMAPGVSASLVTTVFGLLVAIPAMFGYNFLVTTIRSITVELDNFASEVASTLEHQFVEPK